MHVLQLQFGQLLGFQAVACSGFSMRAYYQDRQALSFCVPPFLLCVTVQVYLRGALDVAGRPGLLQRCCVANDAAGVCLQTTIGPLIQ
jgi:hypothetical protein